MEYQQKAIGIQEEILDPHHTDLGKSYNNMAMICKGMEAFSKAIIYQDKSINIFRASLPQDHPTQQVLLHNLLEI